MISDQIDELRSLGKTDDEIAGIIAVNSRIEITASKIAENYASPEDRHQTHG